MNEPAYLLLEDGTLFHGTSFGAPLAGAVGETCFWTGMTDYQETISDPALSGKILVLTHPGVGNVGVNARDLSSDKPRIRALIVREASSLASNYRSEESLGDYLIRHGIPALTDIDTRALTLHIRESGPLRGIVGSGDPKGLESMFQSESAPAELPLLEEPVEWTEGSGEWRRGEDRSGEGLRIGVLDWGARRELLRLIVDTGASVVRIPMSASEDTIRSLEIDGLILPNGALEPLLKSASLIDGIGALIGKKPLLGIESGALILGSALGLQIGPLKTGRRGPNHTVRELDSGALLTTTQNHGHRIESETLPPGLEITHRHLHGGDIQGFRDTEKKLLGIQFSPERTDDPTLRTYYSWLR